MSNATKTATLDGGLILAVTVNSDAGWRVSVHIPLDGNDAMMPDWSRLAVSLLGAKLGTGWGERIGNGFATRTVSGKKRNTLSATTAAVRRVVAKYAESRKERESMLAEAMPDTS